MNSNKKYIEEWDDGYGGDLDSPYSEAYLLRKQKALRDIDVCGVQDDCYNEICPCFLLKTIENV